MGGLGCRNQPASAGSDASRSPTTLWNGSRACHSAAKASVPHPRVGPPAEFADAIHRPFTSRSRTSTQNSAQWSRYCCTAASCTALNRTRGPVSAIGVDGHRVFRASAAPTDAPRDQRCVDAPCTLETSRLWITVPPRKSTVGCPVRASCQPLGSIGAEPPRTLAIPARLVATVRHLSREHIPRPGSLGKMVLASIAP